MQNVVNMVECFPWNIINAPGSDLVEKNRKLRLVHSQWSYAD